MANALNLMTLFAILSALIERLRKLLKRVKNPDSKHLRFPRYDSRVMFLTLCAAYEYK
jgi:hypothetical protein